MPDTQKWTELVDSIAAGDAVLVLGPDAIPYYDGKATKTFSQLRTAYIKQELGADLLHFYKRDQLFQFNSHRSKGKAIRQVRQLAQSTTWIPDSELLRQIVAMPFSVVINLNPDKHLYDAYAEYWRAPQFDYFTTHFKPDPPKISYPNSYDQPLLYNLGGSVLDARDSVVLDYQDLFATFKHLLSDIGVAENLWQKLQKADQFILLGFELERWSTQLFINYINRLERDSFENKNQNFPILCKVAKDSESFVMRQFNIEQFSLSRADFDEIYRACESEGILRPITDPSSDSAQKIRRLVLQNRYEEALVELAKESDEDGQLVDIPMLQSSYNEYIEEKQRGTSDEKTLQLKLNRLRYAILTFAQKIGKS